MRVRTIDLFRGIAITLMIFFTVLVRLTDQPGFLRHNVPFSFHIGDVVLPLFIFASGMSLFFFRKKREGKKRFDYAVDVAERLGKLALVSFFIFPFTSGEPLGMDEVMLIAVISIPSLLIAGFSEQAMLATAFLVLAGYSALDAFKMLPDFSAHYLGGYAAAVFYLPLMVFGMMAAKRIDNGKSIIPLAIISLIGSFIFLWTGPADKMAATPAFMMVSISICLLLYMMLEFFMARAKPNAMHDAIERMGRDPIRYWVLMFALAVAPVTFYAAFTTDSLPIGLPWPISVALALSCIPALCLASIAIDRLASLKFLGILKR